MRFRSLVLGLAALALTAPTLCATSWGPQTLAPSNSTGTFAPNAPPRADLTVNIVAPNSVFVGEPGTYQLVVRNIGRRSASAVNLSIALPRTNTSPQVHVLGDLGAIDPRCSLSSTNLICALGSLAQNGSTTANFTIALPQSSAPLVVTATVTTASVEVTTANNVDSDTAHLLHPLQPVSAGQSAHVEHCTGGGLVSFFECELYPSSISFHDFDLLSGGLISFVDAPPQYTGTWNQTAGDDRLSLRYFDDGELAASFEGYAVGDNCFEGVTNFHPPSTYVAPYRVCID